MQPYFESVSTWHPFDDRKGASTGPKEKWGEEGVVFKQKGLLVCNGVVVESQLRTAKDGLGTGNGRLEHGMTLLDRAGLTVLLRCSSL